MKKLVLLALVAVPMIVAQDFDAHFTSQTMRLDYFHSGNAGEEHIAVDRIVSDGPWPGHRKNLIDSIQYGKYLFEVWDGETLTYSRGYSTIYGEWETTGEANTQWGVFHESLRFPWPKHSVKVVLKKRDASNVFHQIWETTVNPTSRAVTPANLKHARPAWPVYKGGDPKNKVDLLLLGDGYTAGEMEKFHKDAKRMANALFAQEPFKSRKSDFNVWAIDTPSGESGVSRPHAGVFKRSALTAHYSSFDSERYVLSYDNRTLRDIASAAPYEYMVILLNERTYGGGGIYLWQATAAVDSSFSDYLFVHEFGHHFASLADEYYTSSVAYDVSQPITVEPYEPNITALLEGQPLKWAHLMDDATPLPTPWEKEAYETYSMAYQKKRGEMRKQKVPEEEMEALFEEIRTHNTQLLGNMTWSKKVGAFEGGGYRAKGLYRPQADCMMFTRDKVGFCKVCAEAIDEVIDLYSK